MYDYTDPSLSQTPAFSISLDTPQSSTRMDDQSPISPEHSNARPPPSHWIKPCDEYFPASVPTTNPNSHTFTYGNWEEWMRWDGAAEALSPEQLQISPPAYRKNRNGSSFPQQEAVIASSTTEQEAPSPGTKASLNRVSLSSMDLSPFSFGYNDGNQADFQFGEAIISAPEQSSPREYGFRSDNVNWNASGLPSASDPYPQLSPMTMEEHHQLRNIAFQRTSSYGSPRSYGSVGDINQAASASPEPAQSSSNGKKRKSSGGDEIAKVVVGDPGNTEQPPVKKTAHNMIEKRYRTNLNDKIAALRDSVPSLRAMPKSSQGNANEGDDDREDLDGLTPAHKLNKATVLSKATEYIQHLERRNKRLEDENSSLRTRIRAFEKLAIAGSINTGVSAGGTALPPRSQGPPFSEGGNDSHIGTPTGPQGMIQVPENIKKLRTGPYQPHYADQTGFQSYQHARSHANEGEQKGTGNARSKYISKLMVGSLAGLVVLEGFIEKEHDNTESSSLDLFAVPLELLENVRPMMDLPPVSLMGSKSLTLSRGLFPLLEFMLALGVVLFLIFLYLFNSKPKLPSKVAPTIELSAAPSLALPIEVRRKAWLASIQTVWVHSVGSYRNLPLSV